MQLIWPGNCPTYFEGKGEDFCKSWCFFFSLVLTYKSLKITLIWNRNFSNILDFLPQKPALSLQAYHVASEGLLFPAAFILAEHMKSSLDGGWLSVVKCDTNLRLPLALTPAPYNSHHAPKMSSENPLIQVHQGLTQLEGYIQFTHNEPAKTPVCSVQRAVVVHQWISAENQTGVMNQAQCAHHIKNRHLLNNK